MDKARNKLCNVALMTAAGVGLLLLVAAKRRHIFSYFKKEKNLLKYKRIEVVQTVNDCHRVISQLKKQCDNLKVLGFDCEWVTVGGTRRPVALLQLSSGDGLCALFRLCCLKQIPKSLRDILEDDNIVKVGIAPEGDAQKLAYDYGVFVASTFDLRFLAALTGKKPEGLAKMSKSVLDVELIKHWRLVCSDWEAKDLSEKQLEYAANDALVAVEIFKKLSKDVVLLKGFWGENSDFDHIRHKLEPFYDVHFKDGCLIASLNSEKAWKKSSKVKNERSDVKKTQTRGISTRSKALYDNCLLEAPDGELLCTIDRRKAKWYLDQSLGVEVLSEPFTVRLNFEPAGRAVGEVGKYYQTPKENKCVVCGQKESFMRKNVIPREYRKHFPEVLKSHTSHDVLLLCLNCHRLSNISDLKIRHKLSKMCNAPLTSEGSHNTEEFQKLRQVKSAARALLKCKNQIPEERRKSLECIVLQHFDEETEISCDLLLEASEIETKENNTNNSQHGERVVKKFQTELGGLLQLEKIWREHFIHTMQPKYLPTLWNVNHSANRL